MIFQVKKFIISIVAKCLKYLSPTKRVDILMSIIGHCIKRESPGKALQFLFELDNRLYFLEGEISVKYGKGIHTKHRHINYHQFFIKNLNPDERVLDVGSGNGLLCYEMVIHVQALMF